MANEQFLIDSNAFMTPYLNYYPFDLAPSFWRQLEMHIQDGAIIILDMVKDEVKQGHDDLSAWMNDLQINTLIDHRQNAIIEGYSDILGFLQSSPCYKQDAVTEWSKATVADPWLIATAAAFNCTIITFEKPIPGLSEKAATRRPKIPDVAREFGVKTQNLFYLMRQLNFHL